MVKRRYVIVATFTIVLLLVAIIISVTIKNSNNKTFMEQFETYLNKYAVR